MTKVRIPPSFTNTKFSKLLFHLVQLRTDVDLNLLTALDRLLETRSVTLAAEQLHVSVPAMSHTLARIRTTFNDPILVRSGRTLVPTPRAEELRSPVREIVEQTQMLFVRPGVFDASLLHRTFVIRASDAVVGTIGPRLAEFVARVAPRVTLRFASEGDIGDVDAVRGSEVDVNISARLPDAPDIEQRELFHDHFVGLVRRGHPLTTGRVTAKRFAAQQHVVTSRRGVIWGPIDDALRARDLARHVGLVVPTFYAAVFAAVTSDLVATVPSRLARETKAAVKITVFNVPVDVPTYGAVLSWHRRFSADPAHRWLRDSVEEVVAARVKTP